MSARITFLRRSPKEIEVYGGEVFFDIDGVNVGKLATVDCYVDLPAGRHTIRMYKSHNYGTLIGFADIIVDIREGEHLMARYTAPMTVSQPGYITLAPYNEYAANAAIQEKDAKITHDQEVERERKEAARRGGNAAVVWIIVGSVSAVLLTFFSYFFIFEALL